MPDGSAPELADDIRVIVGAIQALGAECAPGRDAMTVASPGYPSRGAVGSLQLGCNGTALRCLTAIVGGLGGAVELAGDPGLARRPLGDLVAALEDRGARLTFHDRPGRVPFRLQAPPPAGRLAFAVDLSLTSQAATGLLLACAASPYGGTVRHAGPRAYLDLTCQWLRRFGARVTGDKTQTSVEAGLVAPAEVEVPADPSAAAWMMVLAVGLARPIEVVGLGATAHPDARMIDHLRRLGCRVVGDDAAWRLAGSPGAGDYEVAGLADSPDLFPPLVALLTARPGWHALRAAKLRHKESDRIAVLAQGLTALGFDVTEEVDGLRLRGKAPSRRLDPVAVALDPQGDHRMAMAFAVIARLHGYRVHIRDFDCVAKSWPGFRTFLERCAR